MLDPSDNNRCPACPLNAFCNEKAIYPAEGHVRLHDKSEVMVGCFNEKACAHGTDEEGKQNTNCVKPKYGGVMCAHCEEGFWKPRGTTACYKCEWQSTGFYVGLGFAILFLILVIYRTQLRNFPQSKNEILAVWRIWINQFHFIYILNTLSDTQYN